MISNAAVVREIQSPREIESFLRFPWQVYQGDPFWIPPILSDMRKLLKGKGLFFNHCRHQLFAAEEDNRMVGTLAAFYDQNYVTHWNERAGFLGFFEALPQKFEAISDLFQKAEDYLRSLRAEMIYAPFNAQVGSYPMGLLEDAYGVPPVFLMAYNPDYYHEYLNRLGYERAKKMIAYQMDLQTLNIREKISGVLKEMKQSDFRLRPFDKRRFAQDAALLARIYSETFKQHWGYAPSPEEEFVEIVKPFRPILDPDMILFAEKEGKTVGFVLCVPDYNPLIRSLNGNVNFMAGIPFILQMKKMRSARLIAIGVLSECRGKNVAPYLVAAAYQHMIHKNYVSCEYSWVLEENIASQRVATSFFGDPYRNYSVYSKKL